VTELNESTEPRYPYVHVDVPKDAVDEASTLLWELGAQGLEERDVTTLDKQAAADVTLVASFETEDDAKNALEAIGDTWTARLEHVVGDAWRDAWRAYFKPTRLGPRLVIRPSWEEWNASPTDVVITIDPGHAFGSGTHSSTRLILQGLDQYVRGGEEVLDVGAGSGILSVAALLLGAKSAICIDIEDDSVAVSHENAEHNRVRDRLQASTTPLSDIKGEFPLVLANIEARVLIPLADQIAKRVAPGGMLFMSGILVGQEDDVLRAYPSLECVGRPIEGEWISLYMRNKS
jgi:ribosomal protein L11 methyltransferase